MPVNERYQIEHVYLVTCTECNEDIGRTLSGKNPTTRDGLKRLLADHDHAFHKGTQPSKKRGQCVSCLREFSLNSDGTIRHHSTGSGLSCRGSGSKP